MSLTPAEYRPRPRDPEGMRETALARFQAMLEIQTGPNPLSDGDLDELARRYPHEWADIADGLKKARRVMR